jgi:hypothetical protein
MQSSEVRAAIAGPPRPIQPGGPHTAPAGPPRPVVPPPLAMSVGSPETDDALVAALETAHNFISRVTGWKGHETERQDVLEMTAAALQAIVAS